MTSMASASLFTPVFAQVENPTCVELGNCTITDPLEWALTPFTIQIGDYIYPVMWGMIVGVIYIRTGNTMLVSLIGLLIGTAFLGTSVYTASATGELFYYGWILIAVSIGLSIYSLLKSKLQNP